MKRTPQLSAVEAIPARQNVQVNPDRTDTTALTQSADPFIQKPVFGFWVYLMTDCVLFATLFATYAVLHNNTNGGPSGYDLFNMHNVFIETLLLLTSSFTCGLGMLAAQKGNTKHVLAWFSVTFMLGVAFLILELNEFHSLVHSGNSWQRSGFLSGFFTLVGTHGLHIASGLLWMLVLVIAVARRGLSAGLVKRLTMLSLFWHLLDIVWIFIFTVVYLLGAV